MRYAHFRNVKKRDITIAYTVSPTTNPLFAAVGGFDVRLGIAVCAPGDTFVKAKGRMIAEGRYNKRPAFLVFGTNDNRKILDSIYHELLED